MDVSVLIASLARQLFSLILLISGFLKIQSLELTYGKKIKDLQILVKPVYLIRMLYIFLKCSDFYFGIPWHRSVIDLV